MNMRQSVWSFSLDLLYLIVRVSFIHFTIII